MMKEPTGSARGWVKSLDTAINAVSIGVVIAALVLGVRHILAQQSLPEMPAVTAEGVQSGREFSAVTIDGQWLGPPMAPVTIELYSTYTCGFCAELARTLDRLRSRYPQHVAILVRHFVDPTRLSYDRVPLGAECAAEQGVFAAYHRAAFSNGKIVQYSDGWLELAKLASVPDLSMFTECVRSQRGAETVRKHYEEGLRRGVSVTPTMFVNGKMFVGNVPFEILDAAVAGTFPQRQGGR